MNDHQDQDWVRDPVSIKKRLKVVNNKTIAVDDLYIEFPEFYIEKNMATIGSVVYVVGMLKLYHDNIYAVMKVNTILKLTPSDMDTVYIDGIKYYRLFFVKGSVVIDDNSPVEEDIVPYRVYHAYFTSGMIPYYFNYYDMCSVFDSAKDYAGVDLGGRPEIIHTLVSMLSRDKDNPTEYYRRIMDQDSDGKRFDFISIKNIELGTTSTITKLGGNYFERGLTAALLTETKNISTVEKILRY